MGWIIHFKNENENKFKTNHFVVGGGEFKGFNSVGAVPKLAVRVSEGETPASLPAPGQVCVVAEWT